MVKEIRVFVTTRLVHAAHVIEHAVEHAGHLVHVGHAVHFVHLLGVA